MHEIMQFTSDYALSVSKSSMNPPNITHIKCCRQPRIPAALTRCNVVYWKFSKSIAVSLLQVVLQVSKLHSAARPHMSVRGHLSMDVCHMCLTFNRKWTNRRVGCRWWLWAACNERVSVHCPRLNCCYTYCILCSYKQLLIIVCV